MDRFSFIEYYNFAYFEHDKEGEWVLYTDFYEFRKKMIDLMDQLLENYDMESLTPKEETYKKERFDKIIRLFKEFKDEILIEMEEETPVSKNKDDNNL